MKFAVTRVVLGGDLDITEAQLDAMLDAGLVLDMGRHRLTIDGKLVGGVKIAMKRHEREIRRHLSTAPFPTRLPGTWTNEAAPAGALTPDDATLNRSGSVPKSSAGNSEGEKP